MALLISICIYTIILYIYNPLKGIVQSSLVLAVNIYVARELGAAMRAPYRDKREGATRNKLKRPVVCPARPHSTSTVRSLQWTIQIVFATYMTTPSGTLYIVHVYASA